MDADADAAHDDPLAGQPPDPGSVLTLGESCNDGGSAENSLSAIASDQLLVGFTKNEVDLLCASSRLTASESDSLCWTLEMLKMIHMETKEPNAKATAEPMPGAERQSTDHPETSSSEDESLLRSVLPKTDSSVGDLKFQVFFAKFQHARGVHPPYVFVPSLNKMFAHRDEVCPVILRVEHVVPNLMVCIRIAFAAPEYRDSVVERCHNHLSESAKWNDFMELDAAGANVRLPGAPMNTINVAWNGEKSMTVRLKFACLNSCHPISRRTLLLSFTLKSIVTGESFGQQQVEVKVCASPARDSESELRTRGQNNVANEVHNDTPSKRQRETATGGPVYEIRTTHREDYKILLRIQWALEIERNYKLLLTDKTVASRSRMFSSAACTQIQPCTSIEEWLKLMKLSRYSRAFKTHGIHTVADVADFTVEDFINIGVKRAHVDVMTSWLSRWSLLAKLSQLSSVASELSIEDSIPKESPSGAAQNGRGQTDSDLEPVFAVKRLKLSP